MGMNGKVWVLVGVGLLVGPAVRAQEQRHQVFVERWWASGDVGDGLWAVGYEYRFARSGALRLALTRYLFIIWEGSWWVLRFGVRGTVFERGYILFSPGAGILF